MTVYDLIFMACLSLNQGGACKQQMLQCVIEKRDAELKTFIQSNNKTLTPEQFLNSQPQAKWDQWVLDCTQTFKQQQLKVRTK